MINREELKTKLKSNKGCKRIFKEAIRQSSVLSTSIKSDKLCYLANLETRCLPCHLKNNYHAEIYYCSNLPLGSKLPRFNKRKIKIVSYGMLTDSFAKDIYSVAKRTSFTRRFLKASELGNSTSPH